MKVFVLLEAHGVPASEADALVAALEVELGGMAPASRGAVFSDGWYDGVTAVSEALVRIADREWSRHGGPSAGVAELAVHIADVRKCERADLVRLERFVRVNVLPRATGAASVSEALGEAGGLCTARTVNGDETSSSARSIPGTTTRTTSRRSRTGSRPADTREMGRSGMIRARPAFRRRPLKDHRN